MKKSMSYWSFPGGLENTAPYGPVFARARELGFQAVECAYAAEGVISPGTTEAECLRIREEAREAGVEIASLATGVYWSVPLTAGSPEVRAKAIEHTKNMLRIARWLGTDAILVVPGAVDVFFSPGSEVVSYDVAWDRARESVGECLGEARRQRVAICVENVWNKFLLSPLEMKRFVDQFRSKWVKCYFDTGNVIPFGYPEQWIRILGRRIARVHLKDHKWRFVPDVAKVPGFEGFARGAAWGTMGAFCDLGAGDVDWPAVVSALREAGYDGYLTAEMLPPSEGLLERTSADMDRILER